MAQPPYDENLERAFLGAALLDPDQIPHLAQILDPTDLYIPSHVAIWSAMTAEHDAGHRVDASTVASRVKGSVTGASKVLADIIAGTGSTTAAPSIAVKIADLSALRRVQALASEALDTIDATTDPAQMIDHLAGQLNTIDLAQDSRTIDGLYTAADMMHAEWPEPPPVIPGFLSREDRLMIVGLEGSGKSVLARMIAAQVASGVHPFWPTQRTIEPQPTLVVDVENPERVIRTGLRMMKNQPDNMHILARPGGINLRSRRDRSLLHRVCERVQPRLMTIGPIYKMAQPEKGEDAEGAASALQAILDEIRIRFGCALIIEHHAPKGSDIFRKITPFGSSAWLRWPEFGWQLIPYDEVEKLDNERGQSLRLGTFRGDRVQIDKPHHFYRGGAGGWPWMPYWPEGPPERF